MFDDFYDKLKEYYQMKYEYEQDIKSNKNKIMKASNITLKEKQEKIINIKPKCINCKRPVGTIFDIVQSENVLGKTVLAYCGDKTSPCPLKIELYMGYIRPLIELIKEEEEIFNNYKKEIINLKNKLVIGAISDKEVIEYFKILKDKINISSKLLETYKEKYTKITENADIIDKIKINTITLNTLLNEINNLCYEFDKNNNISLIQDAMSIYVNDFVPLVKSQLSEKYEECYIQSIPFTNTQTYLYLIQNKHKPDSLDYIITEPRILSFVTGISFNPHSPNKIRQSQSPEYNKFDWKKTATMNESSSKNISEHLTKKIITNNSKETTFNTNIKNKTLKNKKL